MELVICELLFVKFTLCIYPFHVCKYDVISLMTLNTLIFLTMCI